MKKIITVFILLFLNIELGYSQYSVCGLTDVQIKQNFINCLKKKENVTNHIIDKITEEIGIASSFTYIPCRETYNAAAVINPFNNNARYIVYDDLYFSKIYANNKYASLFIIAHEIGHHINGHTIRKDNNISEKQRAELEADYFAGFIMFKFGAKEKDIIDVINGFPNPKTDYESHPKNAKRLEYALKGYLNEANKYMTELYRLQDVFRREHEDKEQDKLVDDLRRYINNSALQNTEQIAKNMSVALYIIDKLKGTSPYIERLKGYVYFKSGMYKEAKIFYKDLYLMANDKDKDKGYYLEMYLSSLDKSNQILQDDIVFINRFENSNDPNILFNLGISYKSLRNNEKGDFFLKKAYDLVKNQDDTLLKSDIIFHYARVLYDEGVATNDDQKLSFAKVLILKSIKILNKYPDNIYFRFYYNRMLFHLGNIQKLQGAYNEALDTFHKLLEIEEDRGEKAHKEYRYKVNSSIGDIYMEMEHYPEAIQYYTNAINYTNDPTYLKNVYFQRSRAYIKNKNYYLAEKDLKKSCELGLKEACISE